MQLKHHALRRRGGALLVGAAALLVPARARAVEGGTVDRVTTHAVAIATRGPTAPLVTCSGELVSDNVVLTVRHCIAPVGPQPSCASEFPDPVGSPGDLWVDASASSAAGPSWKRVARWVVPEPRGVCGNDVALLVLADPLSAAEATPAVPAMTRDSFRSAIAPRSFGLAGFGATAPGASDVGVRRSRFDIALTCAPAEPGQACGPIRDAIDLGEFVAGDGPCSGDSGAGALAAADHGLVFGVLSRANVVEGRCAQGVFERTDVWAWLIARTVVDAAPAGAAPAWAANAFPETPRIGEFCRGAGACEPGADCVSLDDRRSFVCAARCESDVTCNSGQRCRDRVCVTSDAAPEGSGGCAIGGERRTGEHSAAGYLAALAAVVLAYRKNAARRGARY